MSGRRIISVLWLVLGVWLGLSELLHLLDGTYTRYGTTRIMLILFGSVIVIPFLLALIFGGGYVALRALFSSRGKHNAAS